MEVMDIFRYRIGMESRVDGVSPTDVETLWAVVEKFFLPESFVSNNGVFMFKVGEDEEKFMDTWLLVVPSNIEKLISFLQRNITYGDFLSAGKSFYIVKWDLREFKVFIESKVKLEDVKDKIAYIWNQKLLPEDEERILKIIDIWKRSENGEFSKCEKYTKAFYVSLSPTSPIYYDDKLLFSVFYSKEMRNMIVKQAANFSTSTYEFTVSFSSVSYGVSDEKKSLETVGVDELTLAPAA